MARSTRPDIRIGWRDRCLCCVGLTADCGKRILLSDSVCYKLLSIIASRSGTVLLASEQQTRIRFDAKITRRAVALCVIVLSVCLQAFVAQTHVHATQAIAAQAHGHAAGRSFESDDRLDSCVLCDIVAHAAPLLFGNQVASVIRPVRVDSVLSRHYNSPPLILAHRGRARAPPSPSI